MTKQEYLVGGVDPDARREATPRHVGSEGWEL